MITLDRGQEPGNRGWKSGLVLYLKLHSIASVILLYFLINFQLQQIKTEILSRVFFKPRAFPYQLSTKHLTVREVLLFYFLASL